MTILQIMKLLHHSQGYSQYTFIQKYRISHISHSGLNRHWSVMWALANQGNTWRSLPALADSQSGSGCGWGSRKEDWETERNTGSFRETQVAGSYSGMNVCPPEGQTQACSEQQPVFVHQQPAEVTCTGALPTAVFTDYLDLKISSQQATFDHHSTRGRSDALCCSH